MRILSLYLAREYIKIVFALSVLFVGLFTLFDFIEKIDNFHEAGVDGGTIATFFMLQTPELLTLMLPMAVLLGTVITLGLMVKRNEIVAIKASGVSLFRFSLPILLVGAACALIVAGINETTLPQTKSQTNFIWDVMVEKRPGSLYHNKKFWYKGHSAIYHVGLYDETTQTLTDLVYYRFDQDFNLTMRIDARRARFLGGKWVFFSGLAQKRLKDGGYSAKPFEEFHIRLPERPGDFTRLVKPSDEMNFAELNEYIKKIDAEGYDSRRYRVDLHGKISFPFVCLIMALIGIPLALFKQKGDSMALSVILGVGGALLYWTSFSYVRAIFGYTGVLPPVLTAWLINALFVLAGLWMVSNVRQ